MKKLKKICLVSILSLSMVTQSINFTAFASGVGRLQDTKTGTQESVLGHMQTATDSNGIEPDISTESDAKVPETATDSNAKHPDLLENKALTVPILTYSKGVEHAINAGANYLDASADVSKVRELDEFTLTMMFKTKNTGLQSIFNIGSTESDTANKYFSLYVWDSKVGLEIRDGEKNPSISAAVSKVADGSNHMITLTYLRDEYYKIYVDGALVLTDTTESVTSRFLDSLGMNPNTMTFGSATRVSGNNYPFTGSVQTINIFDKALADEEIMGQHGNYNVLEEGPVLSKEESKLSGTNIVDVSDQIEDIESLDQATIHTRFRVSDFENNDTGLMSLFSVSNKDVDQTYASFYIKPKSNSIGMEIKNNNIVLANPSITLKEDNPLNDKEWHTASYVFNEYAETWSIYLDGVLCGSGSYKGLFGSMEGINTARVGGLSRSRGDNIWALKGNVDLLEVYDKPVSSADIKILHNATIRGDIILELPENATKTDPYNVFYGGYDNSSAYRIPAILTTENGVVIAAIDKRQSGAADSGNIDSVIRRSLDGGETWEDPQVLIDNPVGVTRASLTIDASLLQDKETGRIYFLVDMFPESNALMQSNLLVGGSGYKTVNGKQYLILKNYENNDSNNFTKEYTVREGGKVWMEPADTTGTATLTEYTLPDFSTGNLFKNGTTPAGNIFLYSGSNAGELKVMRTSYLWMVTSDDDGETWSKPFDITGQVKEEWMYFLGTGPGVGMQIENGEHAGRLVLPVYHTNRNIGGSQCSAVIYSDDNGETWELGESPNEARDIDPETMNNYGSMLTESQVVEVGSEGRLKIFMRNPSGHVFVATSDDGGETWSNLYQDMTLIDKYCQLTVIKYPNMLEFDGVERQPYIFANPVGPNGRENGTVRIGYYNEDKDTFTWPYEQLVQSGSYAYSCLTVLEDGDIGLFYEGQNLDMQFTKFSPDWVTAPRTKPMGVPEIKEITMVQEGNILTFDVSFDQPMMVVGKPVLKITVDGADRTAVYLKGRAEKKLRFQYILPEEDAKKVKVTNVATVEANEIGSIRNELPKDVEYSFTLNDYVVVDEKIVSEEGMVLTGSELVSLSEQTEALSQMRETTINARFRVDKFENNDGGLMSLFSISNSELEQTYATFYIKPKTNAIGMEIKNNGTILANPSIDLPAGNSLADNEWHTASYVINHDLGKWSIYLDGLVCGSGEITSFTNSMQGLNYAQIGGLTKLNKDNGWNFIGNIDSLEVYSVPYTKEQIDELHKLTKRGEIDLDLPDTAVKTEAEKLFYKDYDGSVSYRIPSILTTKNGVVIAGIDKRQWGAGDSGNIDAVVRRSLDNGKTWLDPQVLIDNPVGEKRASFVIDASMVQNQKTGRIFFLIDMFPESSGLMESGLLDGGSGYKMVNGKSYLILRNYENSDANRYTQEYTVREDGKVWMEPASVDGTATLTGYTLPDFSTGELYKDGISAGNIFLFSGENAGQLKVVRTSYLWMVYSDNDGETWSKPMDITGQVKESWMYFLGTGPGVGTQIENGPYAGRLIFPVYYTNANIGGSQSSAVIYSDDDGVTWQLGESPNKARDIDPETMNDYWSMLTEAQVVEVGTTGRLKIFMRNPNGFVFMATSDNGGETWSNLYQDKALNDSYCQMTVIKYPEPVDYNGRKQTAYIFANPAGSGRRTDGTVRIGFYDEATDSFTWPYKQLVHAGSYSYSCLTALPDGNVGLFYEGDVPDMWFTQFSLDWITAPRSKLLGDPEITKISMERKGDELTFNVKFDQPMMVFGAPVLKLNVDGKEVFASYAEGNRQKNIVFKYVLENPEAKAVTAINVLGVDGNRIESVTSEQTEDVNYLFKLNDIHDFTGQEVIIKEPDCTTAGSKKVYCADDGCEEFIIVSIPALGHDYGDWVITKHPTQSETGLKQKVCKRCDLTITEVIAKLPSNNNKPNSDSSANDKPVSSIEGKWETSETGWVFKKEDGSLLTDDWGLINGKWYYFAKDGAMVTGWKNLNGTWYLMADSGAMETGWAKVGDTWYYLEGNGAMATGWVMDKTTWYCLNSSGAMITGWKNEGDIWYYLNANGSMATNCVIDGYTIDKNGVMN